MNNSTNGVLRGTAISLILALFGSAFVFAPKADAALTLPTTPCDSTYVDFLSGFLDATDREDGTKAFAYGDDNNSFVEMVDAKIHFSINILFEPDPFLSSVRITGVDQNCQSVPAFGVAFIFLQQGHNLLKYDPVTYFTEFGEQSTFSSPPVAPRYLWIEVIDHFQHPERVSYSYLVDVQNLQNPTGTVEEEEPGINRPVIIVPGLMGSAEKNGEWVLDPILHTYDDLVDTLKANGYVENETLFTFPYDWHKSNVETSIKLKEKIDTVKETCNCSNVDIVAHSMGGLVARQYVQSDAYEDDIKNLIFLGTPHLGSPNAYLAWEDGQIGFDFETQILEAYITYQARKEGYTNIFSYVRNKPITSIEQLLPIYDYLKDYDTNTIKNYPEQYPTNLFLENLSDTYIKLLNTQINITNILGVVSQQDTIGGFRVKPSEIEARWEHGYPYDYNNPFASDKGVDFVGGDGTVPQQSSELIVDQRIVIESEHKALPTNAKAIIYNTLTGLNLDLTPPEEEEHERALFIRLFSPVDMQIIAPDGKRVGKNFETNQELNEIEDAFYSGFETDDEFITILDPIEGEYKLITQGTDNGEYTAVAALIDEDNRQEIEFNGVTSVGMTKEVNLTINNDEMQNIGFEVSSNDIIKDIELSYGFGWIKTKGVKTSLIQKVKNDEINEFSEELDSLKGKQISHEAYILLKEDINWLINN